MINTNEFRRWMILQLFLLIVVIIILILQLGILDSVQQSLLSS